MAGKKGKLLVQVRDKDGGNHIHEIVTIKREMLNLDRLMYMVLLNNGKTTMVFPNEIEIIEEEENGTPT